FITLPFVNSLFYLVLIVIAAYTTRVFFPFCWLLTGKTKLPSQYRGLINVYISGQRYASSFKA
ncbi:TPA: hypothetical protein ACG64R_002164, partial [Escherichia coli]